MVDLPMAASAGAFAAAAPVGSTVAPPDAGRIDADTLHQQPLEPELDLGSALDVPAFLRRQDG
jgi:hypothetical protein